MQRAARLAHPWNPDGLEGYSVDGLVGAVGILRRHKVSVMALRHTHGNAVLDSPLATFVNEDRARYRREREEYEEIRQRFAVDGIDAMLFKSTGLYPSFHYLSSNLDVIVPEGRARDARGLLDALGYVELLNVEEPRKFLFRRFPGDGSTYAFHLHEVVGWGVPFLDNDSLWANARRPNDEPDILIPGPREALLITLAHWFYEDKELALGNLFLTANAVREYDGALSEAAELAANHGWEDGFWGSLDIFNRAWSGVFGENFLDRGRADEVRNRMRSLPFIREQIVARVRYGPHVPATVPFLRNKVAYYRKVARDPARSSWRKVWDTIITVLWAVRWKLHVRSQHPLLVSISGCDGSGKTLHVDRLRGTLDTCDIRNRVIWSRGASSRLIAPLLRVGKLLTGARVSPGESGEAERFDRRQRSLRSPLARGVFGLVYALDLAWTYCVRTRLAMLVGNVVVCDRYVYDAIVDYALYTGTTVDDSSWAIRWLARVSPRPHVRILLDVEAAEALRRKPEEGATRHLEAAREGFLALGRRYDLMVMPPQIDPDEAQRKITAAVLDAFYERYGTFCNALLCSNPSQLNPRPGVR